jgi:putative methyltransferase (TIGR04325 family)
MPATASTSTRKIWDGIFTDFPEDSDPQAFSEDRWTAAQRAEATALLQNPSAPSAGGSILPEVLAGWHSAGVGKTTLVDFGGGLALEYIRLRGRGFPVDKLRYTVIETPPVCTVGRELFAGEPNVTFRSAIDEVAGPIDVFHAGSSLQYVRDWRGLLDRVQHLGPRLLVLAGTLTGAIPTFASLQNYYGCKIPMWFVNQGELQAHLAALDYTCISDQPVDARYFGRVRNLPMAHFPKTHRLPRKRHLIFARNARGAR